MSYCPWLLAYHGCPFLPFLSLTPRLVSGVTSFAAILFDAVVVAVTLSSTLEIWKLERRSKWQHKSLNPLLSKGNGLYRRPILTKL